MTLPRLLDMTAAYGRRRTRELYELGCAVALATHDPQRLSKAFAAPSRRVELPTAGPLALVPRDGR